MATYREDAIKKLQALCKDEASLRKEFPMQFIDNISPGIDKEHGEGYSKKMKDEIYKFLLALGKKLEANNGRKNKIYNKIKHCGMIIFSGNRLQKSHPDSPAIIRNIGKDEAQLQSPQCESNTPQIVSLQYSPEEYEALQNGIFSMMHIQKHLIGSYLIHAYPNELMDYIGQKSIYKLLLFLKNN